MLTLPYMHPWSGHQAPNVPGVCSIERIFSLYALDLDLNRPCTKIHNVLSPMFEKGLSFALSKRAFCPSLNSLALPVFDTYLQHL
jgi:hypothetical protein